MEHTAQNRVDPRKVYKLYDDGMMPSQIATVLEVSLSEVVEHLDRRRKENAMKERS
jgi:transposase-like protein